MEKRSNTLSVIVRSLDRVELMILPQGLDRPVYLLHSRSNMGKRMCIVKCRVNCWSKTTVAT